MTTSSHPRRALVDARDGRLDGSRAEDADIDVGSDEGARHGWSRGRGAKVTAGGGSVQRNAADAARWENGDRHEARDRRRPGGRCGRTEHRAIVTAGSREIKPSAATGPDSTPRVGQSIWSPQSFI